MAQLHVVGVTHNITIFFALLQLETMLLIVLQLKTIHIVIVQFKKILTTILHIKTILIEIIEKVAISKYYDSLQYHLTHLSELVISEICII